jgi:hypothetical protein
LGVVMSKASVRAAVCRASFQFVLKIIDTAWRIGAFYQRGCCEGMLQALTTDFIG